MRIKYFFLTIIFILISISISQIFTIPPYSDDIYNVYKSGYFKELDRNFNVIKDSFIGIKTLGKPVYGWIFLKDIEEKHKIKIKVYDKNGYYIPAPGQKEKINNDVQDLIKSLDPQIISYPDRNLYKSIIPIYGEQKCKFCHSKVNKRGVIGAMSFERDYDGYIYYGSERILIFIIIATFLALLFFAIIKWDPSKNIKELFDKTR